MKNERYINKIIKIDVLDGLSKLENDSIDMILTDPPYNIGDKDKLTKVGNNFVTNNDAWGKWDVMDEQKYFEWIKQIMVEYDRVLKSNGSCIMFVDKFNITYFRDFGLELGWHPVNFFALIKNNPVPNLRKNGFTSGFELGIIFNKNKEKRTWNFSRQNEMMNYFKYNIGKKYTTHPTEKPLKCFKKLIEIYTNEHDVVLDTFSGSGTTLIASKQLNRNYIGFEIDDEYYNIINHRLEQNVLTNWF